MSNSRILTLAEVSERTTIAISTLRWLRHKGAGPPTWKLGGRVVAYEDEVDAWVRQQYEDTVHRGPGCSS